MRRVRAPLRWRLASAALGLACVIALPAALGYAAHGVLDWIMYGWRLGR